MFTEILAAGAMGISVFFVVKAHSLLKDEQAKETPRPSILRQITIFMGFAILMTPLALGIEYARHEMNLESSGQDNSGFVKDLERLQAKPLYSFDQDGDPQAVAVSFAGKDYELSAPYPDTFFAGYKLQLLHGGKNRYNVVKDDGVKKTSFGFLEGKYLATALSDLFSGSVPPVIELDENLESVQFLGAGMVYAPYTSMRDRTYASLANKKGNYKLSNQYLLGFLGEKAYDNTLQKEVVNLLISDDHMAELNSEQYTKLIDLLSDNSLSVLPRRYYELAQVYFSRYWQQGKSTADYKKYLELLCSYKDMYNPAGKDTTSVQYKWYAKTKKDLEIFKFDNDCNCISNCP